MSIELKQAAQQALDALVKSKNALEVLWVSHHANRTDYAIEDIDSAIEALLTAIQQAESEPVAVAAPHIAMGFGRYEVGSGTYQGTPCIAFGKNGTGKVGEFITMEPRQMSAEETVAVITFANAEGLDVLQEKVDEVRALHFAASSPSPWLQKPNPAPGVPDDVVRDAERYRWLRQHQLLAKINYMPTPSGEDLDAAIDAAKVGGKQ